MTAGASKRCGVRSPGRKKLPPGRAGHDIGPLNVGGKSGVRRNPMMRIDMHAARRIGVGHRRYVGRQRHTRRRCWQQRRAPLPVRRLVLLLGPGPLAIRAPRRTSRGLIFCPRGGQPNVARGVKCDSHLWDMLALLGLRRHQGHQPEFEGSMGIFKPRQPRYRCENV